MNDKICAAIWDRKRLSVSDLAFSCSVYSFVPCKRPQYKDMLTLPYVTVSVGRGVGQHMACSDYVRQYLDVKNLCDFMRDLFVCAILIW